MIAASMRLGGSFVRGLLWGAVLAMTLLSTACGSDVVFVGDLVLESTLPDTQSFEAAIRDAGRAASLRSHVYWPQANLDAIALEPLLQELEAGTVALSPYLSLLIGEVASSLPERRFIAYYGTQSLPNLTWVRFDPLPAMTEAGAVLARWVFDAPGRTAVLLVDQSDRSILEEGRALASGYEQEAGVALREEAFSAPPSRDDVRSRVQAIAAAGERAVVVLLGTATGWALEQLRDEQTVFGLRHAAIAEDTQRMLFTVRDDLALGLELALGERGAHVVAPSVLDVSASFFPSAGRD